MVKETASMLKPQAERSGNPKQEMDGFQEETPVLMGLSDLGTERSRQRERPEFNQAHAAANSEAECLVLGAWCVLLEHFFGLHGARPFQGRVRGLKGPCYIDVENA